jgi:thymidylate synthase (FAD)
MTEIPVLDHGFVALQSHMGGDLSVVNAARVSFGKFQKEMTEDDEGLIGYLMRERHGTPFEHNSFSFRIKAPIFIFREWQRHRIGSFNEMSARYMELADEWYVPYPGDVRVRVGKPGHYEYEAAEPNVADDFVRQLAKTCRVSYGWYKEALEAGIAPEQARLFLHVNHYSEMWWTVNARSLMNFISLRSAPTAQWEIRQYSQVIESFFRHEMPVTYSAFVKNRVAP